MIYFNEISVLLGIYAGLFSLILNYRHLLNRLLRLEFLALMVYWWLRINIFYSTGNFFFVLFYLVIVVCEGVLGLSLLIGRTYRHGSDYIKIFRRLNC